MAVLIPSLFWSKTYSGSLPTPVLLSVDSLARPGVSSHPVGPNLTPPNVDSLLQSNQPLSCLPGLVHHGLCLGGPLFIPEYFLQESCQDPFCKWWSRRVALGRHMFPNLSISLDTQCLMILSFSLRPPPSGLQSSSLPWPVRLWFHSLGFRFQELFGA